MKRLLEVLRGKNKEEKEAWTVSEVKDGDFEDWGYFWDKFCQPFEAGVVLNNHMFTVKADRPTTVSYSAAEGEKTHEYQFQRKSDKHNPRRKGRRNDVVF